MDLKDLQESYEPNQTKRLTEKTIKKNGLK